MKGMESMNKRRRDFLLLVMTVSAVSTPAWPQAVSPAVGAGWQRRAKRRLDTGFLGRLGPYEAKTVMLAGRRYIVCRNGGEGCCRSGFDRSRTLERQLAKGDKALVGNTSYRRYLKLRRALPPVPAAGN